MLKKEECGRRLNDLAVQVEGGNVATLVQIGILDFGSLGSADLHRIAVFSAPGCKASPGSHPTL